MRRKGDWMQTYSGKKFYPLDPRPEEIDIIDIAHALSMICRYGGHTLRFYSVAEHSWHVSQECPDYLKLAGLLHDAAEAYIADLIRPIKPHIQDYKKYEDNILMIIAEKYDFVKWKDHPRIKKIDHNILKDEHNQVMFSGLDWYSEGNGIGRYLYCWRPVDAERWFLKEFNTLIKWER